MLYEVITRLGYWELDWDAREIRCSVEACLLLGLGHSPKRFSFDEFFDHVHPEERDRVRGIFSDAIDAEQPFSVHYRAQLPKGQEP